MRVRLQLAVLRVGANVLQGSQDIVRRGRGLRQVAAHHMEAQLVGYVARLDGNALGRGVAVDANRLEGSARRLDIDAVARLEGVLKHTLVVQWRHPVVRDLGIMLVATHQSPDAANPHQAGIQLRQGQDHHQPSHELKPREVLSDTEITDRNRSGTQMGSGPTMLTKYRIFLSNLNFRAYNFAHTLGGGLGNEFDLRVFLDSNPIRISIPTCKRFDPLRSDVCEVQS